MRKIAIVGSREYDKMQRVVQFVANLPADEWTVISGGARGVDYAAEQAAKLRGIKTEIYPAEWGKYGKSAGAIRNRKMVEAADEVVAFWDGKSPGTKITISLCDELGKPCTVYR